MTRRKTAGGQPAAGSSTAGPSGTSKGKSVQGKSLVKNGKVTKKVPKVKGKSGGKGGKGVGEQFMRRRFRINVMRNLQGEAQDSFC